jgi:hypothetical protein
MSEDNKIENKCKQVCLCGVYPKDCTGGFATIKNCTYRMSFTDNENSCIYQHLDNGDSKHTAWCGSEAAQNDAQSKVFVDMLMETIRLRYQK